MMVTKTAMNHRHISLEKPEADTMLMNVALEGKDANSH